MKKIVNYSAHTQEGLLLNANEMSNNLSAKIISEIQEAIPSIAFNRYPEDSNTPLRQAYANVMGVDVNCVLAGNGSDQILGLLIGYYLGKGKTLLTLSPDFGMYDYYCTSYEASIEKYETKEDGSFDISDFIEYAKKIGADMILFSNPNNPTGFLLNNADVETLLQSVSIPVVIDEAYGEFAKESALKLIDTYSNLYVTRTLSKAYGLAGARVGFLISNANNVSALKAADVPYVLNSISQVCAMVVLKHAAEFKKSTLETISERDSFYVQGYKNIKLYPSQGNFIKIQAKDLNLLFSKFDEAGIVVRKYEGRDYFRLTIGSKEDNDKVKAIFSTYDKEVA